VKGVLGPEANRNEDLSGSEQTASPCWPKSFPTLKGAPSDGIGGATNGRPTRGASREESADVKRHFSFGVGFVGTTLKGSHIT